MGNAGWMFQIETQLEQRRNGRKVQERVRLRRQNCKLSSSEASSLGGPGVGLPFWETWGTKPDSVSSWKHWSGRTTYPGENLRCGSHDSSQYLMLFHKPGHRPFCLSRTGLGQVKCPTKRLIRHCGPQPGDRAPSVHSLNIY